ncbi:MAG: hypothetical protein HQL54_05260 [Magnetococcales bacterium]|nr:hypothetical protein [Magnetococcales bacterium]
MAVETMMFKVGEAQATQLPILAGNKYTIGQAMATKGGLGSWVFLHPAGSSAAAEGMVAVKIQGTQQLATLSTMTGKSFVVGQAPLTSAGVGNWLVLSPAKATTVSKGAALAATGTAGAKGGSATKGLSAGKIIGSKKAATSAAAAAGSKGTAAKVGTGLGLGLGLSTGGTVALFGAFVAVGIGIHSYMSRSKA